MEEYRELGNRYLKQNRRRSVFTVLGCLVVAAMLYVFLNFVCGWLDFARDQIRKENDYEILILTDERDKIQAIVNEDFVRSAYMGKAYSRVKGSDEIYANALHINVDNILFVKHYNKYLQETYGVSTELNDDLLWTYIMDEAGEGKILILGVLFISYIFAIIGVGIISNSVQLSAMERIRDYGDLRCIGATKKQVRAIVFRESIILETIGIAGGILLGYIISVPLLMYKGYEPAFHFIPILFIAITFYGDMYFSVGDGVKKVLKVSPIEAVKGNYRITTGKLKQRESGIWGLIFGVEGDYAYKNIKRNSGRFYKTVGTMAFGLATVVVISGIIGVYIKYITLTNEDYGYYQQYLMADTFSNDTTDEMKAQLYSPEALMVISDAKGVEDTKYIFHDTVYTSEKGWVYEHLERDYVEKSTASYMYAADDTIEAGYGKEKWKDECARMDAVMKKYRDSGQGLVDYDALVGESSDDENSRLKRDIRNWGTGLNKSNIDVFGYDAEDYDRLKNYLTEGTLELSENGILLVDNANLYVKEEYNSFANGSDDYMGYMPEKMDYKLTDLKIGDKITIVDPAEMEKEVHEEMERSQDYLMESDYIYIQEKWILESARQKLAEERKCKTYVIEGILKKDPNRKTEAPTLILPLEKYFSMTGQTTEDYSGFKFHVSNILSGDLTSDRFLNALHEKYLTEEDNYTYTEAEMSEYLDTIQIELSFLKTMSVIAFIILGIVLVSTFNTINTAISNLKLRQNEFAQLRALGMTKKGLLKTVLLEGGIVWIISSLIGIVIGILIEYGIHMGLIRYLIASNMYIAWLPILVAVVLEFAALCGTNITVFKELPSDIATELTRTGE